jgi:hypothetical protein
MVTRSKVLIYLVIFLTVILGLDMAANALVH